MNFSIVVVYRDRGMDQLCRCVNSLLTNTGEFELIVCNYGSTDFDQVLLQNVANQSEKLKIINLNARGWLFNKAIAINAALKEATGENLVIADVDLIFPANFTEILESKTGSNKFLNYRCIYLDEGQKKAPDEIDGLPISDDSGVGLIVAPIQKVLEIGGYDEYYRMWGFEDLDMHRELLALGLQHSWIEPDELKVYHIWHPKHANEMPGGWFEQMKSYYDTRPRSYQTSLSLDHRSTSALLDLNNSTSVLKLDEISLSDIAILRSKIDDFLQSESYQYLTFQSDGHKFEKTKNLSLFSRIANKISSGTKKEIHRFTFDNVKSVFFYTIIEREELLADYFFEFKGEKMKVILKKR